MNGVVYKQWYSSKNDSKTPAFNVQHLKYIATRPGVIQNQNCGFGLWGKIGQDSAAGDINNLKAAMGHIRRISKEHTVYRAVISLDEDTALQKGLNGRAQWQTLVTAHADAIAKQNNIDLRDFRWCASYHQERGHPHVHIMFWDDSDKIREEYMPEERFEIASEKIRAAFNGDVFKEELKQLRTNQDTAQKELRTLSRNHVEGFSELQFFAEEPQQEQNPDVQFYPRDLKPQAVDELCRRLDEVIALLPAQGQLKYQYLDPNVKAAVDAVSQLVLQHTTLQDAKAKLIDSVIDVSKTYGNSEKSIQRQIELAEKRMLKDVGNDVLKTVKSLGGLEKKAALPDEMYSAVHERILDTADIVLQEHMNNSEFLAAYNKLLERMPAFLTPRNEVLQDAALAEALRELTLQCMSDPRLRQEMKIGQAFVNRHKTDARSGDSNQDNANDSHQSQSEEFKSAYQHINRTLYDMAANTKGWTAQAQFLKVNNFLRAFCRMTVSNHSLQNSTNKFLLLRELSKQARTEHALKAKDSSKMWDMQI